MNHGRIESRAVGIYISENLRLSFGPLLKAGPVQLHHNTLAMAMPRTRIARVKSLFKNKEPLVVVAQGVLFWRYDLAWRFHRRMLRLESHLEEGASSRRLIRLAWLKDRDIASGHLTASLTRTKLDLAERNDHTIPAAWRSGRSARRRVPRHTHVIVLERYRRRLKQQYCQ